MRISVDNYDVFERVQNITKVDYEIIWKDAENIEGYIDENTILGMMEDLILEIDRLKEEQQDREQDIQDNYIHRPMSDYTGDGYDDRF